MSIKTISKCYYRPDPANHSPKCPRRITSTYRVITKADSERKKLVSEYAAMRLVHLSKHGVLKNELRLTTTHRKLESHALSLNHSGASNILINNLSFDCLITDCDDNEFRDYLTIDLRIPGTNSKEEPVFSYEIIEKMYGGKPNLYAAIKHFYQKGRVAANPEDQQHGHNPKYDPTTHVYDRFIRHTEQLLIAYLALPKAAKMICQALRTKIRGKYPKAASVKLYNMGLHMHSTKTCCAPCEYSLVGLMNERDGFIQGHERLGFLPNFTQACARVDDRLSFKLPDESLFRLLVTVSANESDADHKKDILYFHEKLSEKEPIEPHDISVKDPAVSKHIYTVMFDSGYDRRKLPDSPSLSDVTVGISGSKKTRGSPGTMSKVTRLRKKELNEITTGLALLTL